MKFFILCALLISSLSLSFSAPASPLEDKIKAFKKAIKDEVAAKPDKEPTTPIVAAYSDTGALMASLDQIPSQLGNPNTVKNTEIQISQLLACYSSEPVQKTGQELLDEIHAEHKARSDAVAATIQGLLKSVLGTVQKTKKAEELDGLIAALQKFLDDRYGFNSENQASYQEVSSALEFTKLWQNYLSHLNAGQSQAAINDLQSINQNNYAIGIFPRSEILDRISSTTATGKNAQGTTSTTSEAVTIITGIKTLDEMEPALKQLAQLQQNDPQASRAYANLAPLVQLYTNVKAGLPETLNLNFGNNNAGPSISPGLQARLLIFVLQHYFDAYKGPAPAIDEKPETFVNRVITDAVSHEDWPLLRKAVTALTYLNRNSALAMSTTTSVTAAVDNLLAGVNQEAASQYAMAVVSYQSALKVSDTTLPAKLIGDKLAAIKKDHPKEYEEGMQMVLTLSTAKTFSPPINMNGHPAHQGYPGSYDAMSVPSPALSIPGGTTNQLAIPSTNAPPAK